MNYYQLFRANTRILLFAILLTCFSGFGQTFLLSLYIPDITKSLNITDGTFSLIYALATLVSGFTIVFTGKYIDRFPLRGFTLIVVLGIFLANILAGFTVNIFMLFMAILMLRFFGQGMLSHTAMTTMGRYFHKARGKALSIAYLGYPLAEVIFPTMVVLLLISIGWNFNHIHIALGSVMLLNVLIIFWGLNRLASLRLKTSNTAILSK